MALKPEKRFALEGMEHLLRAFGPMPAKEFLSRLIIPLSEEEVWDVIRHAEKIGMIEKSETFLDTSPLGQNWRLVEGFDRTRLELEAPT